MHILFSQASVYRLSNIRHYARHIHIILATPHRLIFPRHFAPFAPPLPAVHALHAVRLYCLSIGIIVQFAVTTLRAHCGWLRSLPLSLIIAVTAYITLSAAYRIAPHYRTALLHMPRPRLSLPLFTYRSLSINIHKITFRPFAAGPFAHRSGSGCHPGWLPGSFISAAFHRHYHYRFHYHFTILTINSPFAASLLLSG